MFAASGSPKTLPLMQPNSYENARAQRASFPKVVRAKTVPQHAADDHSCVLLNAHDTRGAFTLTRTVFTGDGTPTRNIEQGDELFLVENGRVQICIGTQSVELGQGDIALLRRGVPHAFSSLGNEPFITLCWVFGRIEDDLPLTTETEDSRQVSSLRVVQSGILRAGEGTCWEAWGGVAHVVVASSEVESRFCTLEIETPPLGGPPMHVHEHHDKVFLVRAGRYEFCLDDARVVVEADDVLWVPCHVTHSYRVVSSAPGRLLDVSIPGGLDSSFAACAAQCKGANMS